MAAVIAGNGLGLFNSAMTQIGAGSGRTGPSGDNQYVNVATGNLMLQGQDEQLLFRGLSVGQVRTYNSLGVAMQVGGDGWLTGFERKIELGSGTLNAAGSVMRLHVGDGAFQDFTYVSANLYRATSGDGAHDTLTWTSGSKIWTYLEGTTRRQELYADHASVTLKGRLTRIRDLKSDGTTPVTWDVLYDTSQRLSQIRSGDGTTTGDALVFAYDANGRIASLSTRENGIVRVQVTYGYDSSGRLTSVLSDLTPLDGAGDRDTWDASVASNNDRLLFKTQYTYADATTLRISQVQNSDGSCVSYTYDGSGRVHTVTRGDTNTNDADGAGQTLTFTYDVPNRSTDVSDSTGRTWSYVYDTANLLTQIKSPAVDGLRDVTSYTYDASGNITKVKTERGAGQAIAQTDYKYDANGNVLWQWEVLNPAQNGTAARAVERTYTTANQVEKEIVYTDLDPDGVGVAPPTGGLASYFIYDAQNRLRFVVNAVGDVKEIEYATSGNGIGQVATTREYLGAAYSGAYTLTGATAWATTARKADSTRVDSTYDLKGRLAQTTAYASVNSSGIGITDDSADVTQYVYDAQGLLRQSTAVRSSTATVNDVRDVRQTTTYAYDGIGRLLSETLTEQVGAAAATTLQVSTWAYLDSTNTLRTTLEGGAISDGVLGNDLLRTEVRNAAGQLIAVTESAVSGGTTRTAQNYYDTAGRLRASQDAAGGRSYFFYDPKGALSAQVDPTGALIEYVHDGVGRVIETVAYSLRADTTAWLAGGVVTPQTVADVRPGTDPGLRRTTRLYDGSGHLMAQTDPEGAITTYSYDGANRLLQTRTTDAVDTASTARLTRYFHDAAGREVGRLDAEGYLVEVAYDRAGRRVRTTAYANSTLPVEQRPTGTLASLRPATHANDQVSRLFYDGRGNVVAELNAEGYLTDFVFDEARNQRAIRSYGLQLTGLTGSETLTTLRTRAQAGAVRDTRRDFDARGLLLTELTFNDGNVNNAIVTRYTYDAQGRLLKSETAHATTEQRDGYRRYDVFGNLVGELGGEGAVRIVGGMTAAQIDAIYAQYGVRHEVDALGRRIESTDAQGNKTWYFYDAAGRLTQTVKGVADAQNVRNAEGEVTETRYTAFGEVRDTIAYTGRIAIAAPFGRDQVASAVQVLQYLATSDSRTQFDYDRRGQLTLRLDALGNSTTWNYNAFGEMTRQTMQIDGTRSLVTTSDYDLRGLRTSQIGDLGGVAQTQGWTYDAFGRVVTAVDARNNSATFGYDRLGRQVSQRQTVAGRLEQALMSYDAWSRVLTQTDALNRSTLYTYNDTARSVVITTPEGVTLTTVHNRHGQTDRVTDAKGNETVFTYNKDGQLTHTRAADTGTTEQRYDARGQVFETIDATGRKVGYEYDAVGRVLARIENPAGLALTTRYSYDGQGRQVSVTDAAGIRTSMAYDLKGQLKEVVRDTAGLALKTTYTWDARGLQLSVTEGAGTAAAMTVACAYDNLGRRTSETQAPGTLNLTTSYTFDANDNVVARTDAAGRVTRYTYDEANRTVFAVDGAGGVVRHWYDVNGRVVATRAYAQAITAASLPLATTTAAVQALVVTNDTRDVQQYTVYDNDGRARLTIDGAGAVANVVYDAAGRQVRAVRYANAMTLTPALRTQLQDGTATPAGVLAGVTADAARDQDNFLILDTVGRVRYTVGTDGSVSEMRYDLAGRVTQTWSYATALTLSAADRTGLNAGTLTADALGTRLAPQAATARVQYSVFDAVGRERYSVLRSDASSGIVSERLYDAVGRTVAQVRYGITIAFDPAQTESGVTAALEGTLSADAAVRATQVRTTRVVYDTAGRQRFAMDASGAVSESRYDATGRVLESRVYGLRPPANTLTEAQLNTWGQAQAAANVRSTFSHYDTAGRVDVRTDALGKTEKYLYDGAGLLTEYTDRNDAIWNYGYDAAGRRTSETSPSVTVATVDAVGTVTQTSRRLITRIEYDGQGNVTRRIENADTTEARSTQYVYDNRSHQIQTIFPDAWQINEVTGELEATGQTPTIDISYDTLGRAVVQKDVRGHYSYKSYNIMGQLAHEVDQEGYVTAYYYDAFGQQNGLTRYAAKLDTSTGAFTSSGWVAGQPMSRAQVASGIVPGNDRGITTTYDLRGNKSNVVQTTIGYYKADGNASAGSPTTQFEYDAYGQLTKESLLLEGAAGLPSARWADTFRYYDSLGRNTLTVDAEGYATATAYNATGEAVETIEYARALATQGLTSTTRPGTPAMGEAVTGFDRITRWQYDALGRKSVETAVRRYQRADGSAGLRNVDTTFGYDGEGRVTGLTTDAGTTTTVYDALGRATSVQEPARATLTASAENGLLASTGTDLGSAGLYAQVSPYTTVIYDAFGNAVQTRRYANGNVGVAAPVADAADQIQITRYDRQGRAVMTKDAEGAFVYSAYDQADNVLHRWYRLSGSDVSRDAMVHGRYTYDTLGRQASATQTHQLVTGGAVATELSEQVVYNAFGEIASKTYPGQAGALSYTYDAAGRLLTSNEGGATRSYGYNLAGHQVRESHKAYLNAAETVDAVTWSTTDRLGRTVAVRLPSHNAAPTASSAITQQLDRWGNVVQVIDARGYQTNYQYNDFNQVVRDERPLVEVVSAAGFRTWIRPVNQWFYDAFGRLLATKDANGNVRANEYDAAGRLSKSKDAYGNATLYAYDALGNQRMTQNPLGYLTFKSYDRQNRVTGIGDYLPGANGTTRERVLLQRYTLNQNGDRLSVTDALSYTALYDYDGRNQLLRSQTSMGVVMNYAYNAQGRKTLERYPRVTDESVPGHWETDHESGNQYWIDAYVDDGTTPDRDGGVALVDQLTWDYDVFGRVVDHNNLAGRDFNYGYDAASGMQIAESTAVGTGEVGSKLITYYANGRVRDVVESDGTAFKYEYDAAGNRTLEETSMRDGSGALTHTVTRTLYDSHNRIQRVTQDDLSGDPAKRVFDLTYAYDAVGNRRQVKALSGYGALVNAVPVVNTAPTAIDRGTEQTVSDKTVRKGVSSQFALLFSDIFRDAEHDALTLSIARSDNTALPAWLTVQHDPTTGEIVFIAAPAQGEADQEITVRLTARETNNPANQIFTDFVLLVRDNTPPQLVDQGVKELRAKIDKPWNCEVAVAEYFRDLDVGDRLTLSVVNAATLPWAQIDVSNPAVVRLSGTPTVANTYTLQIRATDEKGASVVKTFEIIAAANSAPHVVAVPAPRDAILGREFGWTQALAAVFTDIDGDALQVTASGMPAWMSFQYLIDQATPELKFAGRVPADELDGRVYALTLKAVDADGAVTTTTLNVTVCANRGPALVWPSGWTAPPLRVYDNYDVTIPIATLFADPEADQIFVVAVGTPAWLNVSVDQNARTIRFHGQPTSNAQAGMQSFQLIARDAEGLASTADVSMAVAVQNAPVRNTAVALNDKTLSIGRTFSFVLPDGLFTDSDGDALTLEATIAIQLHYFDRPDESYPGVWVDEVFEDQLPQWLTFNPATRTFSGVVPGDLPPQALHVRVRANDGRLASGADAEFVGADGVINDVDFLLNLQPFANTAPVYNGGLANQTLVHGGAVDVALPVGTFSEPDSDTLTYSAQVQAGGNWVDISQLGLTINAGTGRISGTAINLTQTSFNARIYARDPQGMLSSPGTFAFGVTNTAPTVSTIPNQNVGRNVAFSSSVAPFFSDVNGNNTLTYTASGLPAGMTCSSTGVISGTPASAVNLGDYVVTVTATDNGNATVASNFTLSVQNSTPVPPATIADQTAIAGSAWSFQFPAFIDPNQDTLTYTFIGAPGWMGFDQASRTLVGTPGAVGSWAITIRATDTSDAWAVKTFTVTTPNSAPVVATAIPTQGVGRNIAWNYTIPNGTFSDANGDPLTFNVTSGLPAGVSFNGNSFSGTPTVLGSHTVTVMASDGRGGTISTNFILNVVNNPPSYNGGLPNRLANQGQSVSWTLPPGSFTDPNGDGLSYSLQVERAGYWTMDNSDPNEPREVWVAPEWLNGSSVSLSINASTGAISGTPTSLYGEPSYQLKITASDGIASTDGLFAATINRAPLGYPETIWVTADVGFNRPISGFSDPDGTALTYTSANLPAGVTLSSAGVLSGTVADVGDYAFQVTASDGALSATATVTLRASNGIPQYTAGTIPNPLPAAAATVAYSYQIPPNAFTDANNDALSYSAYLLLWVPERTDGEGAVEPGYWNRQALPSWLTFNASTRTLSSSAPVQGSYQIDFAASDPALYEGSYQTTFNVGAAPNYAPTPPTLSNQSAGRNQFWTYTVPAFSDPNGDPLTYSTGSLPAGVAFNASTRTFSGSPSALGVSTLTVTANDGRGGVTNASFTLTVGNTAPVAPSIATQTTTAGVAWGYTIPAFTDPNGDALTYTAAGLPAWMSFTAGSRYLSGMPSTVGSWTITVTATDPSGASASTNFTVTTPNRAPTVANGLPNHTIGKGQNWSYQVPSGTFADANNDSLTYSASGMPAGIGFDIGTRTFTGAATALGAYTVTVFANDGRGGVMGTNFTLTVGNSAPVYAIGLPNRVANQNEAVSWTLAAGSFTDANNEALSYSVLVERPAYEELYWNAQDGAWDTRPKPAAWVAASEVGLSINAGNGTLSGNVQPIVGGTETFYSYRIKLIATDPNGAAAEGIFSTSINAGPAPSYVPTQTARQNLGYGYQVPAFSDANGDPLYYWTGALPPGITFDVGNRVLSGTPTVPGNYSVTVAAHDGRGLSTSTTFAFNVLANNAPTPPAIGNMSATVGVAWSVGIAPFSDADGDALGYSASGMPPGIGFNPGNLVFSGTPTTAGSYTVTVTANDSRGGVTSTNFVITASNAPPVNRAPVLSQALEYQYATTGSFFEYTFAANTFTDPDGNALTYTAMQSDGTALPGWLYFDGLGRFSGMPTGIGSKDFTIRVTATDPSGLSVFGDFVLSKEGSGSGNQMQAQSSESMGMFSFDMGTGEVEAPMEAAVATLPVQTTEHWFTYDAENRLKINNGKLVDGQILVDAADGESYELLYDAAGRTVARYRRAGTFNHVARTAYDLRGNKTLEFHEQQIGDGASGVAKTFSYDAAHRLVESRSYFASGDMRQGRYDADMMQYINISIGGWIRGAEQYSYDGDSRLLTQVSKERPGADWWSGLSNFDGEPRDDQYSDLSVLIDDSRVDYSLEDGGPSTYDAAGRATAYRYRGTAIGSAVHTYKTKFEGWETYQEKEVRGRSTDTNYRLTTNTLTYDVMGRLASQQEHTSYNTPIDDRMRYYAYNGDGRVQMRRAGTLNGSGTFVQTAAPDGSMDNTLFVHAGGQQQAELKEGGSVRTRNGGTYETQQLQSLGGSGNYNAGGGKVTVQPGETLQTLAQRIYGTSQRWYVLADANGMSDPNQVLVEGTQINAPNVNVSSNDAETFKPYNANDAIGSTSPSLPYIAPPPKGGCSTVANLIRLVVIVICLFVPGIGWAAAAAIGAGGEAVAQTVEINQGYREGYNVGQIAVAGIMSGVGAGSAGAGIKGWVQAGSQGFGQVARAAVVAAGYAAASYDTSYLINKSLGREDSYNGREKFAAVAAAAVSATITSYMPQATNLGTSTFSGVPFDWNRVVNSALQAIVGQGVNYAIQKQMFGTARWNWGQVAMGVVSNYMHATADARMAQQSLTADHIAGGSLALADPNYRPDWLYGDADSVAGGMSGQALNGLVSEGPSGRPSYTDAYDGLVEEKGGIQRRRSSGVELTYSELMREAYLSHALDPDFGGIVYNRVAGPDSKWDAERAWQWRQEEFGPVHDALERHHDKLLTGTIVREHTTAELMQIADDHVAGRAKLVVFGYGAAGAVGAGLALIGPATAAVIGNPYGAGVFVADMIGGEALGLSTFGVAYGGAKLTSAVADELDDVARIASRELDDIARSARPLANVVNSKVGIPAVRSTNPLSPVLDFDIHGNEIFYRTMSPTDFAKLQRTGKIPATGETFISPSEAYSREYDGVLVRLTTKPGTIQQLAGIGVTANPGTASLFPEMQGAAKGWAVNSAMFKLEGNVVNTGLGRGQALTIFNRNIVQYMPIY